jgi:hypothetical protein
MPGTERSLIRHVPVGPRNVCAKNNSLHEANARQGSHAAGAHVHVFFDGRPDAAVLEIDLHEDAEAV